MRELLLTIIMALPQFGTLLYQMRMLTTDSLPTAGVAITKTGLELRYNQKWFEALSFKEQVFLMVHEVLHIVYRHHARGKNHNPQVSNVAADMLINHWIATYATAIGCTIIKGALELPSEYDGDLVYEALYAWLLKNPDKMQPTMDSGLIDEVGGEEAESIVREAMGDITARGLSGLGKRLYDRITTRPATSARSVLRTIRSFVAIKAAKKQSTWAREYAHDDDADPWYQGAKKVSRRASLIIDTSGSMVDYIPFMLANVADKEYAYRYIQIDTTPVDFGLVKGSKLLTYPVTGGGGTELQPAIDILKKSERGYPVIILTDGFTDELDLSGLTGVYIITIGGHCPIKAGFAKQVEISTHQMKNES